MYTIGIRADAGENIGMGHLMRCMSLAKELTNSGKFKVYFIIQNSFTKKFINNKFDIIELSIEKNDSVDIGYNYGSIDNLDREYEEIKEIIDRNNLDILLIDSYNVNKEYLIKLRGYIKCLIYVDDINEFDYPVDILINGNITGLYYDYKKDNRRLLLGTSYNMIREEFKDIKYKAPKEKVQSIMLTSGGSDPLNVNIKIIKLFLENEILSNYLLNIVVNRSFKNIYELITLSKKYNHIKLYTNMKDSLISDEINLLPMKDIMRNSDIAISSGGSTLYEICACSIPTIAYILAHNQEFIVNKLSELGYIEKIGWHENLENRINDIIAFINDYNKRLELSIKGKQLVDGKGTERITKEIIEWMRENE